ncbi:MAG TPA: hypothetical protein VGV61_12295, partial [Thermoanaerobaculia bacterium]|nr:hypothetical protein [Thermoanaerobaculia bacterium]
RARRYATLSWATARSVAGGAVQEKALRLAEARRLTFLVRAPGGVGGTRIGELPDRLEPSAAAVPPLRVALLGCGAVGGGVLHHLLDRRQRFTLVGVAVRDRRGAPAELPPHLAVTPEELAARPADVLVELAGGTGVEPWIAGALACGRHVVTANKALLAERGASLRNLAGERDVSLRTSAAVGGALPALEAVGRLAQGPGVRALRGVLNGTSSFVLDRLAAGDSLAAAAAEARRRGFAEADPTLDLDGSDAAQKLVLLVRAAWGSDLAAARELDWRQVPRRGIAEASVAAGPPGAVWRLVAQAAIDGGRLQVAVAPEPLPAGDFLATSAEAGNALEVVSASGEVVHLAAQGAGRWPTAEAVLADLEELWRDHAASFDAAGAAEVHDEVPLAAAGEVAS